MIDARELRIGNFINYVHENGNGNLFEWLVCSSDISAIEIDNKIFKPIEIDENWLENFGFHYAPDTLIYGKSGWFKKIEYQDDPTYFFFNNHLQGSIFLSSEKSSALHFIDSQMIYVHQLQNLYFSLTGKELTIK